MVAVKVLRKRWAEDIRKIELFEREGKVGLSMVSTRTSSASWP